MDNIHDNLERIFSQQRIKNAEAKPGMDSPTRANPRPVPPAELSPTHLHQTHHSLAATSHLHVPSRPQRLYPGAFITVHTQLLPLLMLSTWHAFCPFHPGAGKRENSRALLWFFPGLSSQLDFVIRPLYFLWFLGFSI